MYLYLTEFLGKAMYLYLLCVAFANGQRKVDVSVNGYMVVQTNVTTYTIHNPPDRIPRTLTISCLSFLGVNTTVSLLRNGSNLTDEFEHSTCTNRSLITQFKYTKENVNLLQGVYTCGFNFSSPSHNESRFEYYVESEIEINTTTTSEVCGSSVGFSGFAKEEVNLLCENSHYNLHANFSQAEQKLTSKYSLQVSLLKGHATFSCVLSYDNNLENICSHGFKVHESLNVNISPKHFTLDSHVLNFFCNSTPPRMLYWELIEDDENIFNLNSTGDLPKADGITIEIMQRAGWSSLRISTSVEGNISLGIQKVVCYAHPTGERSVAYASHVSLHENITTPSVNVCTCSPKTTTSSFDNDAEDTTKTNFSTTRNAIEQENTNPMQESSTVRQCCHNVTTNKKEEINKKEEVNKGEEINKEEEINKGEEINKWMIIAVFSLAIASFEALLLVIIAGIWTCRKCPTGDKNQSSKSGFSGGIISSETELHENPVYQPYDS
ncbi:hypothetical protein HOLleu_27309 [Holothuria leucospilota]|uniref:Ig-like domain-containing protein n=1 Tax=Holothuria leucospilota TaxID=206669 RepID=A0A9Q1H283_HOLLE|nr:hypothetical protein HOLleu_27309 [Holothuria leucospilota]